MPQPDGRNPSPRRDDTVVRQKAQEARRMNSSLLFCPLSLVLPAFQQCKYLGVAKGAIGTSEISISRENAFNVSCVFIISH